MCKRQTLDGTEACSRLVDDCERDGIGSCDQHLTLPTSYIIRCCMAKMGITDRLAAPIQSLALPKQRDRCGVDTAIG